MASRSCQWMVEQATRTPVTSAYAPVPVREGTRSHRLRQVISKAARPLTAAELSELTDVPATRVNALLAADIRAGMVVLERPDTGRATYRAGEWLTTLPRPIVAAIRLLRKHGYEVLAPD